MRPVHFVIDNNKRTTSMEAMAIDNKKAHKLVWQCETRLTYPTATVVYNTWYHFFRKCPCITVDRDNNTTPAIYEMNRSIRRLEYTRCNEK